MAEGRASRPTLYLHIGTPKTGTTAIQAFCHANTAALARKGFHFPINSYSINSPARNGYFLVQVSQAEDGAFKSAHDETAWQERMDYLAGLLRKHDKVLLSDEIIWSRSGHGCRGLWANLKRAAERYGFDVKFIVYFRSQEQYILSLWAQRVKGAYSPPSRWSPEEAVARADEWTVLDYSRQLDKIASFFGRESITARIYDREHFPQGSILADFLDALGLAMDGDDFIVPDEDANPSLSGNALQIKRILNALTPLSPAMQDAALRASMACCEAERAESCPLSPISLGERRAIMRRYEESNRRLARDYFGDENRQLFPEPAEESPEWTPDNPYMPTAIVRVLGAMILEQQREIDALHVGRRFRAFLERIAVMARKLARRALWRLKRLLRAG